MQFALFYEIPVARPWHKRSEYDAYQAVIEEAVLADQCGFDALWTVEHHFLEEYSHCSNPEVLYGAIAALTKNLRLGYGVRLMPKPYNHPVRTAESVAVLDLISNGRVDLGTGRSSTRAELEGFGVSLSKARPMWREAIQHVVGCWTEDEHCFDGEYWQMPKRRVLPKPIQEPHPPLWGATSSEAGHRQIGESGIGLCSFAVGTPPDDIKKRIDIYRQGIADCSEPLGKFINNRAATFSMMCCAPTTEEAVATATESFEWYCSRGAELIGSVATWMAEEKREKEIELGNYQYASDIQQSVDQGLHKMFTMDMLRESNACVAGDPAECIRMCEAYESIGVDLLLCLVNPYKISHEKVMQTIRLMGEEVLPHFRNKS